MSRKVEASTIVEVIVSMVVIVTVFGIAIMIYSNIVSHSLTEKRILATSVLEKIMHDDEQRLKSGEQPSGVDSSHMNPVTTVEEFTIQEEIRVYNDSPLLTEIILTAYDGNQKKIADLKKVIYLENE